MAEKICCIDICKNDVNDRKYKCLFYKCDKLVCKICWEKDIRNRYCENHKTIFVTVKG